MISAHGTKVEIFKLRKINNVGPKLNFLDFGILILFPCATTIVKVQHRVANDNEIVGLSVMIAERLKIMPLKN